MRHISGGEGLFQKMETLGNEIRPPEMKKVAKTLARHLEGLLNFMIIHITNAVAEGFNFEIQSIKANDHGFRNRLYYRKRTPSTAADLISFPQPMNTRKEPEIGFCGFEMSRTLTRRQIFSELINF